MHLDACLRAWGEGCRLTDQFNNAAVTAIAPVAPKKRGWMPLLTVLFCISYTLMTMLIVEQGQTIESQRALIRELFRDSVELSASKMKAQQEKHAARAQSAAPQTQAVPQNPSSQKPSTQAPQQSPSSQAVPQHRNQAEKQKPLFKMPSRPAADQANDARAVIVI